MVWNSSFLLRRLLSKKTCYFSGLFHLGSVLPVPPSCHLTRWTAETCTWFTSCTTQRFRASPTAVWRRGDLGWKWLKNTDWTEDKFRKEYNELYWSPKEAICVVTAAVETQNNTETASIFPLEAAPLTKTYNNKKDKDKKQINKINFLSFWKLIWLLSLFSWHVELQMTLGPTGRTRISVEITGLSCCDVCRRVLSVCVFLWDLAVTLGEATSAARCRQTCWSICGLQKTIFTLHQRETEREREFGTWTYYHSCVWKERNQKDFELVGATRLWTSDVETLGSGGGSVERVHGRPTIGLFPARRMKRFTAATILAPPPRQCESSVPWTWNKH